MFLDEVDENTWVISDTHFDHENILNYEKSRVDSMIDQDIYCHNEWLLYNWNSVVGVNDLVLHLGDLAFKNSCGWLDKLNGRIVMVLGNHDVDKISDLREYVHKNPKRFLLVEGFNGVSEVNNPWFSAFTQDINGQKVLFSHYPVLSSDPYLTGQITETVGLLKQCFINEGCNLNVHGHLHSKDSRINPNEINVSLERIGCRPIKIGSIFNK